MKKIIYLSICGVAALAALCISCESEEEGSSLSVEYAPAPLAVTGGETSFVVNASGNWSASKTTSWITLTPASGSGKQTVKVTVAENLDDALNTPTRTAKIYILSGPHTETLTVIQQGNSHPAPATPPTISGANTNVCPDEVGITLTASPVELAVSYVWYKDGVAVRGATASTYFVTTSGTYTVAGVNTAGEAGALSADHPVTIISCRPDAAGTIVGASANTCSGTSSTLTADNSVTLAIPEISSAASYTWYFHTPGGGEVVMHTGTSRSYTVYVSGSYSVEGVNSSAAGQRSPIKTVTVTPCFDFTYVGGEYYRMECNATTLNTADGNNIVEPFLSVYNAGKEAFAATYSSGGREFRYFRVILGSSSAASITPYYERAGTMYVAHVPGKVNKTAEHTYTFTNFATTSDYAKPFATNVLSFFLSSGTVCVGATASCAPVPPSGNTFRVGLAPYQPAGATKPIIALYVLTDPRYFFPGIPY